MDWRYAGSDVQEDIGNLAALPLPASTCPTANRDGAPYRVVDQTSEPDGLCQAVAHQELCNWWLDRDHYVCHSLTLRMGCMVRNTVSTKTGGTVAL
jgi:hypothetical protein